MRILSYPKSIFASLLGLFLIILILISPIITGCGNVKGYGNAMLQNLLESIESANYENFKRDMDDDLEEKFAEEEFNKLVNDVKEKYGEYEKYSIEFISSKLYSSSSLSAKFTNQSISPFGPEIMLPPTLSNQLSLTLFPQNS